MDDKNNVGVITEQGYVAGQFGFTPLNESDKKNIEESKEEDDAW